MPYSKFKILKIIIFSGLIVWLSCQFVQPALAVDIWSDPFSQSSVGFESFNDIELGKKDPRAIIANVVQVGLGFLGVLAVVLLIYGGFLWMTANGDAAKVETAKKIIRNAVIGLLIILAAFAIAIYVTRVLLGATGGSGSGGGGSGGCVDGTVQSCGCGGLQSCVSGSWGACQGSDCGNGGQSQFCDSRLATPECDADSAICPAGQICETSSCRCKAGGNVGDPCNQGTGACQADNSKCGAYLTCDPQSCLCVGGPVVEALSPVGGFCDGSSAKPCLEDSDCAGLSPNTCNQTLPNGASGNLVTVYGRYFSDYDPAKSKIFIGGQEASLAEAANPDCQGGWSDRQIVAVVPDGATTGSVRVESITGADDSGDDRGPKLKEFTANSLTRPGLCRLSKSEGIFNDKIDYYGINLNSAGAFFGSYRLNQPAGESIFTAVNNGSGRVPNIEARETTTFVLQANRAASNFLNFNKLADGQSGPLIVSVEPLTGASGQYVTIHGSGFGAAKGLSSVMFNDIEADYVFPAICSQSIWKNNQIVVKVPPKISDGDYVISVVVGQEIAKADSLFKADKRATLTPGLCKLEPSVGRPGDEIKLYGEHFGNQNNNSKARFFDRQDMVSGRKICLGGNDAGTPCDSASDCQNNNCAQEIALWGVDRNSPGNPDKVVTNIPLSAVTGPVRAVKNNPEIESNGLNLTVGECQTDSQCGQNQLCCAEGSPSAGTCRDNLAACYGASDSCVFEWEFSTSLTGSCPLDRPNLCQDGSCCRSQCVVDAVTGRGKCLDNESCAGLGGNQCLDAQTCPNSPGNCSRGQGVITGPSCACSFIKNGRYDDKLNKCVDGATCSLPKNVTDIDGSAVSAWCGLYQGVARWQFASKETCPVGFTKSANGRLCVDVSGVCSLCDNSLSCLNNNGLGVCASAYPVCPNNFTCQAGVCQRSDSTCECCCDKTQNQTDGTNPACCAPLTCGNSCGQGGNLGSCSGCANVGSTQAEHDAACNCAGTSGKFCDTGVAGGVCRDCGQIGDLSQCSGHEACCVDATRGNVCAGIKSGRVFEGDFAYCSYYSCDSDCQTAAKTGQFSDPQKCQGDCDVYCDSDSAQPGCQADENKCPSNLPICGDDCVCRSAGDQPGEICSTPKGACSLLCGSVYTCRGLSGCEGLDCATKEDQDSCRCCCDPHNQGSDPQADGFDKCKLVGSGNLSCKENKEPCGGNERGLCCGCQADSECGLAAEAGCGSDGCCRPRPTVESVYPENNSSGVCRNTIIKAKFSGPMDRNLNDKFIVVGDFGDSLCPGNTFLLARSEAIEQSGWWSKFVNGLKRFFGRLLGQDVEAADGHNFCQVKGSPKILDIKEGKNNKSIVSFSVAGALDANTKYYAIIKGDEGLNSKSGLLSKFKIGFKGENISGRNEFNGLNFANASVWAFETGAEICSLSRVEVTPSQHLFRTADEQYDFVASGKDSQNREITPIDIYGWSWSWSVDDNQVVTLTGAEAEKAVVKAGRVSDATTFVWAKALIDKDNVNAVSTVGRSVSGKALAIVFICANPWPPIDDPDKWPLDWRDTAQNCDVCVDGNGKSRPCAAGDCLNNRFSIYFCRDRGNEATKDDLPSLDDTIRGRYQYFSQDRFFDVLKDFYFFRSALPPVPGELNLSLGDKPEGGQIRATWKTVAGARYYKVYYGTGNRHYTDFVATENASVDIDNLINGTTYNVAVTAVDGREVESAYSEEKTLLAEDRNAPAMPTDFSAEADTTKSDDMKINLGWSKNTIDTKGYVLEYGPNQPPAIRATLGLTGAYQIKDLSNLKNTDYYLNLMAIDAAGNLSQPARLICPTGCESKCACRSL